MVELFPLVVGGAEGVDVVVDAAAAVWLEGDDAGGGEVLAVVLLGDNN